MRYWVRKCVERVSFLLIIILLVCTHTAHPINLTVTETASLDAPEAKRQALQNAMRQAMEQGLGILIFGNFGEDEMDNIESPLEAMSFDGYREVQYNPAFLELEVFWHGSKSRLRRKLKESLKNVNIRLTTQNAPGNRIIFVKEGTSLNNIKDF